jgi:ParB-like chromosome segregation protein Spo0J
MRTAIAWQDLIDEGGISRAEVARRERVSRARVTQLLSLLRLPEDVREALLDEDTSVRGWSVRRALEEVRLYRDGN